MRRALSSCITLSGVASAIYAVAALRELSFVFGSTALALGLTLLAGLGGLAAGALLSTRFLDRFAQPARVFGTVHLALAGFFPISLLGMQAAGFLYPMLVRWHLGVPGQIVLLSCLFVPAAMLAGAVPPLFFAAALARRAAPERIARVAGGALAMYLGGAALGALLAGFILLPFVGLFLSIIVAALIDLGAAALVARVAGSVMG